MGARRVRLYRRHSYACGAAQRRHIAALTVNTQPARRWRRSFRLSSCGPAAPGDLGGGRLDDARCGVLRAAARDDAGDNAAVLAENPRQGHRMSAYFRQGMSVYAEWYGQRTMRRNCRAKVYGLTELFRDGPQKRCWSPPGATDARALALSPRRAALSTRRIVIDSKSACPRRPRLSRTRCLRAGEGLSPLGRQSPPRAEIEPVYRRRVVRSVTVNLRALIPMSRATLHLLLSLPGGGRDDAGALWDAYRGERSCI